VVGDGLPTLGAVLPGSDREGLPGPVDPTGAVNVRAAMAVAAVALATLETQDDPTPLDALVRRLEDVGTVPSLVCLLRARRHAATGDLSAAVRELRLAAQATDRLAPKLRPLVHATLGRLRVAQSPAALDDGIDACREGRRLAVLSACESNLTGATVPNEVIGLPSALLQVGFAGVIASSWKVDDLATAYLMTAFYQLWCQEGQEPAVALNRAQQWLRTATRADLTALLPGTEPEGDGRYSYANPRYWAAFAFTGA
jgi:hypothetical protein